MTIALISDIHANLPALEAVLEDLDRRKPDALYCLGDLVGYAPWPNEVIELIRARAIPTIAGNYDVGVGLNSDDCGCAYKTDEDKERGTQSISWTNDAIADHHRRYLRELPRHLRIEFGSDSGDGPETLLLVHGSPRKVNEYLFEDRPDSSFRNMMTSAECRAMAFGHTHKPYYKVIPATTETDRTQFLHAINTGSVGKPKDGDPRAGYALLTVDGTIDPDRPESIDVEFIRVGYDVERAVEAIHESPLPNAFAEMLRNGG